VVLNDFLENDYTMKNLIVPEILDQYLSSMAISHADMDTLKRRLLDLESKVKNHALINQLQSDSEAMRLKIENVTSNQNSVLAAVETKLHAINQLRSNFDTMRLKLENVTSSQNDLLAAVDIKIHAINARIMALETKTTVAPVAKPSQFAAASQEIVGLFFDRTILPVSIKRWLVAEGQHFSKKQPICETSKGVVSWDFSGILKKIRLTTGDFVQRDFERIADVSIIK
jgi:hypothetical protein